MASGMELVLEGHQAMMEVLQQVDDRFDGKTVNETWREQQAEERRPWRWFPRGRDSILGRGVGC